MVKEYIVTKSLCPRIINFSDYYTGERRENINYINIYLYGLEILNIMVKEDGDNFIKGSKYIYYVDFTYNMHELERWWMNLRNFVTIVGEVTMF